MANWYPTSVDNIVNSFNFNCKGVLKSNLAYNIQYLQYISKNLDEEKTTTVLYRMRRKTFVITGMAVIEAIFYALLDERNLIPNEEWRETTHRHKVIDENTIEVSFKRKRTTPKKKKISFDESIHLIESNNVLDIKSKMYPAIRILQDMRNRLHLNKANQFIDSDYNSFGDGAYELTRLVLYNILNNDVVSKNKNYINFISPKQK